MAILVRKGRRKSIDGKGERVIEWTMNSKLGGKVCSLLIKNTQTQRVSWVGSQGLQTPGE